MRAADLQNAHPGYAPALATALQTWKGVLEGNRTDFGDYPVWFVLLDTDLAGAVDRFMKSEAPDGRGAAPVLNWYLTNFFGTEVAVFDEAGIALVWAKTTSWLIVGVLAAPADPAAASVEVSLAGGMFPGAGHPVPAVVLAGLGYQSWQYLQRASEMSAEQRQKIKDEWERTAGKVAGSDQTRAQQADLAMFGDAAFVNVPEPEGE